MRPLLVLLPLLLLPLLAGPLRAEAPPSARLHHRVLAVVPLIGAGTDEDPRRPMHAPARPGAGGLVSVTWTATDDGQSAIVEFAARDRAALVALLADRRVGVQRFERGRQGRAAVEAALKLLKRGFDLDGFLGGPAELPALAARPAQEAAQ